VSILGGEFNIFSEEGDTVSVSDFGTVSILGGEFDSSEEGDAVSVSDFGTVSILGGEIHGHISAAGSSVVNIYGTGFNYPYGPIADASGTLTGILENGNPIDVRFTIYSDASIILAVPEPSTLALLFMGAGGLLLYTRSRRKLDFSRPANWHPSKPILRQRR